MGAAATGVYVYALLMCLAAALPDFIRGPSVSTAASLLMVPLSALFVIGLGTLILVVPVGWGLATLWGCAQWRLLRIGGTPKAMPSAISGLVPGGALGCGPVFLFPALSGNWRIILSGAVAGAIAGAVAGVVLVSKKLD